MNSTSISDRQAAEIVSAGTRRGRAAAAARLGFSVGDPAVMAAIARIQALQAARAEARRCVEPLEFARLMRSRRVAERRRVIAEARARSAIEASPLASFWRADRRAAVFQAADASQAERLAISATLEAIARMAVSRWGFTLRHTSRSSGQADSRYLALPGVGEVRVSDHEIPVYGERAVRYAERGTRWADVVIDRVALSWSLTRWHRVLVLSAHGRVI